MMLKRESSQTQLKSINKIDKDTPRPKKSLPQSLMLKKESKVRHVNLGGAPSKTHFLCLFRSVLPVTTTNPKNEDPDYSSFPRHSIFCGIITKWRELWLLWRLCSHWNWPTWWIGPKCCHWKGTFSSIVQTVWIFHFLSKNSTLISREKLSNCFGVKTRENAAVLDFLAVDNFDFTRKIVKNILRKKSWKCWGFALFSCWQLWFHDSWKC